MNNIAIFKQALQNVLDRHPANSIMPAAGLCQAIRWELEVTAPELTHKSRTNCSYDIMSALLTGAEFMDRVLGPSSHMTEDRWNFGQFVLQLPAKDIADMILSKESEMHV